MKILIVEDDEKIATFVTQSLSEEGFEVEHASDGEMAQNLLDVKSYHLIVLDLMLPKIDGLTVLKNFREKGGKTPVIILSAKHTVDDRIEGLRLGGDDYLVKPFSIVELLLRIQVMLRHTQPEKESNIILKYEDLEVNTENHSVKRGSTLIELAAREFALLVFMMENQGKILNKTILLDKIWNYNFDPQTNIVDVLVCKLRAKIDKGQDNKFVRTIRGVGYVFGKN